MIDDYSRDLLRSGIIELKAGNRDSARRYIDRALYMSGDHDVMAEGWYWMSLLTDDPVEKRKALENCLSNDLRHARARRALAVLDGKLNPNDIVDPEASLAPGKGPAGMADAQRFVCPKCGGRMTYSPDGQSLVCEYCRSEVGVQRRSRLGGTETLAQHPGGALQRGTGPAYAEKDFLLAMATARGRGKPLAEQVFQCQGCSAQFILPPGQLSITCPYCGSPHVVSFDKSPDLLAPDGIIPHAFDAMHAISLLTVWLQMNIPRPKSVGVPVRGTSPLRSEAVVDRVRVGTGKLSAPTVPTAPPPRGLYLPLWTFEMGGAIDYTGEIVQDTSEGLGGHRPRLVTVNDSYPVMLSRLPIPASRKLSAPFIKLLPTFDLTVVRPYDPRYLADWPAELYDISMAEASLDARSQGFAIAKRDMLDRLGLTRLISTSSANLVIESFRLNLLPVWMTEVQARSPLGEDAVHLVLINGQTGDIYGDLGAKPSHSGKLLSWLSDLIQD